MAVALEDIMVDIETMSTQNNAAVLSIGAVAFSKEGVSEERFYTKVSLKSCEDYGLHIGADTVMWWLGQSREAQQALLGYAPSLPDALLEFSQWLGRFGKPKLWGNGATFDNVILRNAYAVAGMKAPWDFWNDRCFRTLKGLSPSVVLPDRGGVHHNALDDAVYQAECAVVLLNLGENK
jgi:hypothetical protein